jgi:predicted lipoprotein
MGASSERIAPRFILGLAAAGAVAVGLWFFPPFHVVSLNTGGTAAAGSAFDAPAAAARVWATDLPAAARRAVELRSFAALLRENTEAARKKYAKAAGLGTAYYFVRGTGEVTARDRNYLRVALDGADSAVVAIRIGPVFGNTVRDGCGLLEVNSFPGLQEFNALAAELNALVEKTVLPALRDKAVVGAKISFAGCAEAPEAAGGPGEPLLMLVPVEAEVR